MVIGQEEDEIKVEDMTSADYLKHMSRQYSQSLGPNRSNEYHSSLYLSAK